MLLNFLPSHHISVTKTFTYVLFNKKHYISVAASQHAKLHLSCIPMWNAQSNLQPFACKTFYLQNQKGSMALTSMPMKLYGYPKTKINLPKKFTSKTIT